MSKSYLFDIKAKDARRAVRVLYEEQSVPPDTTLEAFESLRCDIDEYISELKREIRDNGDAVRT